ncbi:phage tail tip lysozyme [Luteipulveratus halotolerans]|uniref:Peptidase M23 n=1 Tax=Luteipulveratus halotolerans TaxID=1631356 RepID=A0A0L6CKG4_9MICO|nr:phage tail tip lysozyme [Luteipulveratus halotolerans]KNX38267.1 peptidase M23 [Luteipulveratus halotolerans]
MNVKPLRRRTALALVPVATLGVVMAGVVSPSAAQAAGRDGVCNDGEFCYYYNSYQAGSVSDFTGSVSDYGTTQPTCYEFKGAGNGQGLCVKNNAASVWNRSTKPVTVYYNTGYLGATQTIQPGVKANLNSTLKNNNASHRIYTNNQQTAFNFFVGIGYTKRQSAGIVGNLMQESGTGVDPLASQAGGAGRGIAQWSVGGRWDTYANDNVVWYANKLGMSPYSLTLQLKFIQYELNTFSGYGKSPLVASTTIDGATVVFQDYFERCGTCYTATRKTYAHQVYDTYA